MAKSTSESGHLKNLTGFASAIDYVKTYEKYKPSNALLTVDALGKAYDVFKRVLDDLDAAEANLLDAGRRRVIAFLGLDKLGTRIVAALKANGADAEMRKDAVGMNRKLRGSRAKQKEDPANIDIKYISTSQRSFDRQADNLEKLRDLAGKLQGYAPNETELSVAGLTAKANGLIAFNREVSEETSKKDAAANKRDELLYTDSAALVNLFTAMKDYVRSVYGTSSPEYKQLTAIKIRKIKKGNGKKKKDSDIKPEDGKQQ